MSLQKDIEFKPSGFDTAATLKGAYCRIDSLFGNKNNMTVTVGIYKKNGDEMVKVSDSTAAFVPNMEAGNIFEQAYDYLKGLPEFAESTDC